MLVDANVENVRFMQADTDVTDEQTFTRESMPLKVTMKGRGGAALGQRLREWQRNIQVSLALFILQTWRQTTLELNHTFQLFGSNQYGGLYGEIIEVN